MSNMSNLGARMAGAAELKGGDRVEFFRNLVKEDVGPLGSDPLDDCAIIKIEESLTRILEEYEKISRFDLLEHISIGKKKSTLVYIDVPYQWLLTLPGQVVRDINSILSAGVAFGADTEKFTQAVPPPSVPAPGIKGTPGLAKWKHSRPWDLVMVASNGSKSIVLDHIGPDILHWENTRGLDKEFDGLPPGILILRVGLHHCKCGGQDGVGQGTALEVRTTRSATNHEVAACANGEPPWDTERWIRLQS